DKQSPTISRWNPSHSNNPASAQCRMGCAMVRSPTNSGDGLMASRRFVVMVFVCAAMGFAAACNGSIGGEDSDGPPIGADAGEDNGFHLGDDSGASDLVPMIEPDKTTLDV